MSQPTKLPLPTLGANNLAHETKMPDGSVRAAVNVDLTADGSFRRRPGYRLVKPGEYHSLWRNPVSGQVFVAEGAVLNVLSPDLSLTPVFELDSPEPTDFCEYNGNTYFRGGYYDGKRGRPLGVPTPSVTIEPVSGALPQGRYGIALTAVNDAGEESGASRVQFVEGTGFRLHIQSNTPAVRAYITDGHGEQLRLAWEMPAGLLSYQITSPATGDWLTSGNLEPLPKGQIIRGHGGRLYVAKGDMLCFSEPLRPHLWNPGYGFVKFAGRITLIEPTREGLYVGDERGVWYMSGMDIDKAEPRLASRVPAMERTSLQIAADRFNPQVVQYRGSVPMWLTEEGYKIGGTEGQVIDLNSDRVKVAPSVGKSAEVVRGGVRQVLTLVKSGLSPVGTARDSTGEPNGIYW